VMKEPGHLAPGQWRTATKLIAQVLSDSAVVRPAAPCLETTATQHNDKRGACDDEEQDIHPISAAAWHRSAHARCRFSRGHVQNRPCDPVAIGNSADEVLPASLRQEQQGDEAEHVACGRQRQRVA
jgi:hypothetical protein